jgi:hypothetical protein
VAPVADVDSGFLADMFGRQALKSFSSQSLPAILFCYLDCHSHFAARAQMLNTNSLAVRGESCYSILSKYYTEFISLL